MSNTLITGLQNFIFIIAATVAIILFIFSTTYKESKIARYSFYASIICTFVILGYGILNNEQTSPKSADNITIPTSIPNDTSQASPSPQRKQTHIADPVKIIDNSTTLNDSSKLEVDGDYMPGGTKTVINNVH